MGVETWYNSEALAGFALHSHPSSGLLKAGDEAELRAHHRNHHQFGRINEERLQEEVARLEAEVQEAVEILEEIVNPSDRWKEDQTFGTKLFRSARVFVNEHGKSTDGPEWV